MKNSFDTDALIMSTFRLSSILLLHVEHFFVLRRIGAIITPDCDLLSRENF